MHSSLSNRIPIWHFDKNNLVFNDGSLGAGFLLQGLDISCASIDAINNFNQKVENILTSLEEGIRIQVFYRLTSHVDELIQDHQFISHLSKEKNVKEISNARVNFLKKNAFEQQYFSPEVYFFIRSQPYKYKKQTLFQSDKKFKNVSKEEYQAHLDKFKRNIKQTQSLLENCGLLPIKLGKEKWFQLLYEYFNLDRSETIEVPKLRNIDDIFTPSLTNQLLLTDINIYETALKIGNSFFQIITLKTLPEGQTYASMVDNLTKLPFHFWLAQNIQLHDQKKEIERLQLQRRLAHSMASGSQNVSDIESETKLAQTEDLLRELLDGSEKIISCDLNIIIWSSSKEELSEKADEVLKNFKNMNQAEGLVETLPSFDAYLNTFPGSSTGLRMKKVKSSNAAHLMPVYDYWRGNQKPVCLFPNRDSVLFSIDPFAKELPNWNALIFGGSGAGKSFSISQLMLQFSTQDPKPKIIWIDNGASSERLLEVSDGEFIDLNINSKVSLNMFDLEPGEAKPSTSKVKLILAVLESILKDEEKKGLPKKEKALLEEAIYEIYQHSNAKTPMLSDLKVNLENHHSVEMQSFAKILYSWTGDTAYGKILDAPTNVTLSKHLITIETKGLDIYPDLQNVLLLLFTDFIRNEAARDLATPYLLIIDEAWKLFETPSGLSFTLEAYRTFRKFNGGIWCISQNYKDFLSNQDIKNAVLPNTTSVFVLRQQKIDWNDFKLALDLNDDEVEVVKSLTLEKGKFSEFFFIQDENKAIIRLTSDPLSYWICTNDGNDKAQIEKIQKKYPELTKLEILKKLAYRKHQETA